MRAFLIGPLFCTAALSAPPVEFVPVSDPLRIPADVTLGQVSGIAVDASDRVHVFHRGEPPVLVFAADGKFLKSWGKTLVGKAHGLRVDPEGNVWVTDMARHTVMKFDPDGKPLMALGKSDTKGAGADRFNAPTDVAFAADGSFYVSDGYGNARVARFSKEGKFLGEWGKRGKAAGEFHLPHSIRTDDRGRVYVGDRENNRVQVFDADGKFLEAWNQSGAPYGLCLSSDGLLFVADGRAGRINILDKQGTVVGRIGGPGTEPGQFKMPHAVAQDSRGALYVAEVEGKRVQKFVRKP